MKNIILSILLFTLVPIESAMAIESADSIKNKNSIVLTSQNLNSLSSAPSDISYERRITSNYGLYVGISHLKYSIIRRNLGNGKDEEKQTYTTFVLGARRYIETKIGTVLIEFGGVYGDNQWGSSDTDVYSLKTQVGYQYNFNEYFSLLSKVGVRATRTVLNGSSFEQTQEEIRVPEVEFGVSVNW